MEKITTRKGMIEGLKDIFAVENLAEENYKRDIDIFSNEKIIGSIKPIIEDEKEHIKMIDELIKMLEKG